MAICVECEYCNKSVDIPRCNNLNLAMTDFVYGNRRCDALNLRGDCKGFRAIPKPESIYELKENEEVAKT